MTTIVVSEEVRQALRSGKGVVALESTIITHGMPFPQNLETARMVEECVRDNQSVPATIAILNGVIRVGLSSSELESLAQSKDAVKVSRRDIAQVVAARRTGSTTVAATMIIANAVGIKVFATGGIGGVHRGAESTWDISADITELGRTPVLVVCAGAKSILDLPRTLELLETAGVAVMGFQTNEFPAFFTRKSGLKTASRCDSESEVARVVEAHHQLGMTSGLLLACPIPADEDKNGEEIEEATQSAVSEAHSLQISGKEITPFLLNAIAVKTKGKSLKANIALIKNNAGIAARIAAAMSTSPLTPASTQMHTGAVHSQIHVVGGMCLDTIAVPADEDISGETKTSSPGKVRTSLGGVCRNVARTIRQLGGDVSLISCVGDDSSAATDRILNEAKSNPWIRLTQIPGQRTGQYCAVMNGDGSLCSSVIDLDILDHWTPNVDAVLSSKLVVLDTNLKESVIRNICLQAKSRKIPVWIDCVSVAKCVKLLRALPHTSVVKANVDELAMLAAMIPDTDNLPLWVARAPKTVFEANGGTAIVVTCGKDGVILVRNGRPASTHLHSQIIPIDGTVSVEMSRYEPEGVPDIDVVRYTAPPIENVVDCTGAGDSLFGAIVWAVASQSVPLEKAVVVGILGARQTLMSTEAVSPAITGANMAGLIDRLTTPTNKLYVPAPVSKL